MKIDRQAFLELYNGLNPNMYVFNHSEIIRHPLHQIEYSIIDTCNRNCRSCSHFAPLAKKPNAISVDEFVRNTEKLHSIIPDIHTFWLIGGEPTLHPDYLVMLKALRHIFSDIPIGVMSNGFGVLKEKDNKDFWQFIRNNEIVWRITTYDVHPDIYRKLFCFNNCSNLLSLDINNTFSNLAVLTEDFQPITQEKYDMCGWERLNIFVRNGRIWKCPTVEYIDLFNKYFGRDFNVSADDHLEIGELTRDKLLEFKSKPSAFCRHCDLTKRFCQIFTVEKSKREMKEWLLE